MSYKPEGHNSVSPYLLVPSADEAIRFIVAVFDGVELMRVTKDGGRVAHAEVRVDDSVVMIGEAMPEWPAVEAHVHVYVPDVDRAYQRALAAGARSVQAPVKGDDADKRGGVKDAGGTTWWIGTKVA